MLFSLQEYMLIYPERHVNRDCICIPFLFFFLLKRTCIPFRDIYKGCVLIHLHYIYLNYIFNIFLKIYLMVEVLQKKKKLEHLEIPKRALYFFFLFCY